MNDPQHMKPYDVKKRTTAPDPNPAEAKPRVRIARRGYGSYIADGRQDAIDFLYHDLEEMIEGGEPEDYLRISIVMLSDEAVEAAPEFQGW